MANHYHQGKFTPTNPERYAGKAGDITYRSGWEKKFMIWADKHPAVEKWNSEEVILPYISPVDNKPHRYFVDFAVMIRQKDGSTRKYLIEVKPKAQTVPPKKGRKSVNKYVKELATFAVNQAKWQAAERFCEKHDMKWLILTEDNLL